MTLPAVEWKTETIAPGKINICLHVKGIRADGYHEIDAITLPLELADEIILTCTPAAKLQIECCCPGHPQLSNEANLAARAARTYLQTARHHARLELTIIKKVWTAAGLGGGSADAAAILTALNQQLQTISPAALHAMAGALGADVPFFLDPRPARMRGKGERLTPLDHFPPIDLVLLNPGIPLSTAAVFRQLADSYPGRSTPEILSDPGAQNLAKLIHNDLEYSASILAPEIPKIKQLILKLGALGAGLSGSGPTVFGIFADAQGAAQAAKELWARHPCQVLLTRTLPSPGYLADT